MCAGVSAVVIIGACANTGVQTGMCAGVHTSVHTGACISRSLCKGADVWVCAGVCARVDVPTGVCAYKCKLGQLLLLPKTPLQPEL